MLTDHLLKINIWNRIVFRGDSGSLLPSYYSQQRGPANFFNADLNDHKNYRIHQFVADFEHLSDLYALDYMLNINIRAIANYIFFKKSDQSKKEIEEQLGYLMGGFFKLDQIININKLIREIETEAQNNISTFPERYTEYKAPMMMKKMAMLQISVQKRIECFSQDPIEKAQDLIISYTADDIRHCNDEVLIYLLSRDPEMVHVKKEILNRLEKYSQEWQNKMPEHQNPFSGEFKANRLRIAQWESISRMRNHLGRASWLKELALSKHTSEFTKIFNIFKADIQNSYIERKLKIVLDKLGDRLFKMQRSQSDTSPNIEHQLIVSKLIVTMASLFVFGYTRIAEFSSKTISIGDLDQYLLKHLELYLSHCKMMKMGDIRIVAMALHAICLAKPKGRTVVISQAVTWIMQQFREYGYWGDDDSINTTVLVLDALELVGGGKAVTFDLSKSDNVQGIMPQSITIETEKVNIKMAKSKSKKKTGSQHNVGVAKQSKFKEWENCGVAYIIFNDQNRIIFHYQEEDMDLCLKHSGPVYELIRELSGGACPRSVLQRNEKILVTRNNTKRSLADVLRRTNELLNKKVKEKVNKKRLDGLPDNIKFVGYDRVKQEYRFYIPTADENDIDQLYSSGNDPIQSRSFIQTKEKEHPCSKNRK